MGAVVGCHRVPFAVHLAVVVSLRSPPRGRAGGRLTRAPQWAAISSKGAFWNFSTTCRRRSRSCSSTATLSTGAHKRGEEGDGAMGRGPILALAPRGDHAQARPFMYLMADSKPKGAERMQSSFQLQHAMISPATARYGKGTAFPHAPKHAGNVGSCKARSHGGIQTAKHPGSRATLMKEPGGFSLQTERWRSVPERSGNGFKLQQSRDRSRLGKKLPD